MPIDPMTRDRAWKAGYREQDPELTADQWFSFSAEAAAKFRQIETARDVEAARLELRPVLVTLKRAQVPLSDDARAIIREADADGLFRSGFVRGIVALLG